MNCIDFDSTNPDDAIQAFDMLYLIYCSKFDSESMPSLEQESLNEASGIGITNTLMKEVEEWGLSQEGAYKS